MAKAWGTSSEALPIEERKLKRATRLAVDAAGGREAAVEEVAIGKTQLFRTYDPKFPDSITIRDAAALDELGLGTRGAPFILCAYARRLGFILVPAAEAGLVGECLSGHIVSISAALGDVSTEVRAAFADDGRQDLDEALRIHDEITDLEKAVAALRARNNEDIRQLTEAEQRSAEKVVTVRARAGGKRDGR